MNFNRLQSLAGKGLTEAKSATSDFDGIRGIVDDALGDLSDKLGKGGSLSTLMKSSGAAKLDTVKDADGKNIEKQIVALTTEYKKAITKLLMEAELLVSQVHEAQGSGSGSVLLEAKGDYSDSGEFTDEFFGLFDHLNKMKAVIKAPRWLEYMKMTDTNFGTSTVESALSTISALNSLDAALHDIDAEFDKANGH
jgi:hypothetical protein